MHTRTTASKQGKTADRLKNMYNLFKEINRFAYSFRNLIVECSGNEMQFC